MKRKAGKKKPDVPFTLFEPGGKLKEEGPVFRGNDFSQPDIECPECGYLIAQGLKPENLRNIFTNCPKCGALYHHQP